MVIVKQITKHYYNKHCLHEATCPVCHFSGSMTPYAWVLHDRGCKVPSASDDHDSPSSSDSVAEEVAVETVAPDGHVADGIHNDDPVGDSRGLYAVPEPAAVIVRFHQTPLYTVHLFRMLRPTLVLPDTSTIEQHRGDVDTQPIGTIENVLVPPSYCSLADPDQLSVCRMVRDRFVLRMVLSIPLPFIIEMPAFRCTVHKNTDAKRASYTHWFSHKNATKVFSLVVHHSGS
jgi:hypothetical protein